MGHNDYESTRNPMMKKLTLRQLLTVATMLFGLFFGAGNLIFPAAVGQMAGRDLWWASAGLLITGVGLPLLGVAALGISRKEGLFALSSRLGWALSVCCPRAAAQRWSSFPWSFLGRCSSSPCGPERS